MLHTEEVQLHLETCIPHVGLGAGLLQVRDEIWPPKGGSWQFSAVAISNSMSKGLARNETWYKTLKEKP